MSTSIQERGNEIKHQLRTRQGLTLKAWAEKNGFKYRDVSDVVRGIRFGNFGAGREIAIRLGLIHADS